MDDTKTRSKSLYELFQENKYWNAEDKHIVFARSKNQSLNAQMFALDISLGICECESRGEIPEHILCGKNLYKDIEEYMSQENSGSEHLIKKKESGFEIFGLPIVESSQKGYIACILGQKNTPG